MRITSKELVEGTRGKVKNWILEELLSSMTSETIHSPEQNDEEGMVYEVKLLINGTEVDLQLLSRIYEGVEKIVDEEAAMIANEKLKDALSSVDILHEVIKEAEYKIREKFDIPEHEED